MRIKKNINLEIISWSNNKFSELTLWELYGWHKENYKFDLRVKGLKHRHACEYAEAQNNNMQHLKYAFH